MVHSLALQAIHLSVECKVAMLILVFNMFSYINTSAKETEIASASIELSH